MDVETTRDMLRAAFRNSSELQRLLAIFQQRRTPDEYRVHARRVARAIDTIGDTLINSAVAEHRQLGSKIDDRIAEKVATRDRVTNDRNSYVDATPGRHQS